MTEADAVVAFEVAVAAESCVAGVVAGYRNGAQESRERPHTRDRDSVRDLTVSIPDDVYRAARVRAAEGGRSLSAIITDYLSTLSGRTAEFSRLEAQQSRVLGEVDRVRAEPPAVPALD